jgi:hypothetical protein
MAAGNSPAAANPDDPTRSFTDPFGIGNRIRGKTGAWNENLAKDENKGVFDSMSDDDWEAFANLSTPQQNEWIKKRKQAIPAQSAGDAAAAAQKAKEAAYQQWRDDTLKKLSSFADNMNMSVGDLVKHGDAGIMNAQQQGSRAAGLSALAAGAGEGGLSTANTQRAVADAAMKYQMQRQAMGQQAYGQVLNGLQTQYMNDEDRRRYEQNMNLQLQQAQAAAQNQKYMQKQQQQSGLFGLLGTAVGGYFGGAQGAQAGGQIGQAYGSYSYGQQNPYQPYNYQYPGQTSGYGGGPNSGLSGAGGGYPRYGNSQ